MRCSKCGSENPASKKFCEDCGAPLEDRCAKCGAVTTVGKRFCGECGAPLDATALIAVQPQERALTGERRHLTVLFCDLVGSTEIAAQLDPEEWRELVEGYHHIAAVAITGYGGYVAKYLGDGVMAYFGWPEAHENDAERAARAGLAIVERVSKLKRDAARLTISVRVGVDSGTVVVGAGAGRDAEVFGETPNIASRVQSMAAPDSVLITAATHRLLSGLFVVENAGSQQLKGITSPVELYRVVRPTGVRSRIGVRSLTPFVGREEEVRLLLSRWELAREGEGQALLVVGEAGMGKSRLVAEFHNRIRDTAHIWMESTGEQFFENTPFHAVGEMLSRWLELQSGGDDEERFERLERALSSAGLKIDETAPLIGELLQLPVSERYPNWNLTPDEKRRRLLSALAGWTFGATRLQAVVMVVEDLHWLDPSTLELQQMLAEQGATLPLMLIHTARPEFHAPWRLRAHHTQITLNRLSSRRVREMIAQVAAHKVADETVAAVLERTSGVPLFVEELTRAVLESGDTDFRVREIPVTLRDSLMARLDRLGLAREVIQIGAVIGSEFSYEILHAVHPISDRELQSALRSASDAELIYERGLAPDVIYQFKHALIRDAAYEALLKSRRKELHRRVAQTIVEQFPAIKETHAEVLARHWTEAGEIEPAIEEWSRAAKAAQERHAHHEAREGYQRALAQLSLLPESSDRDALELQLRQWLFSMLLVTRGWAAPEAVATAERAAELAEKSGDYRWLRRTTLQRTSIAYTTGAFSIAASLADQALKYALLEGSRTTLAHVHRLQLLIAYCRGDLIGVEKHLTAALEVFNDPVFRADPAGGFIDVFDSAAFSAWTSGRVNAARERLATAATAVNPASPYDLPFSQWGAAIAHTLIRENDKAAPLATKCLELCEKHKIPTLAAYSRCLLGHAWAQLGRASEGIGLIRRGISEMLDAGSRVAVTFFVTWLAVAQQRAGLLDEALETAEEALEINPEELPYRPETLRVRGELRLEKGQPERAEADFRDSISLARTMGAKAWELRTTISLAQLLDKRGCRDQARVMLAEIYNWFTEGFDTPDLKDAKVLLEELAK